MSAAIITLTSDFGLVDCYAAQMKGVICSIIPDVHIVDVSHLVPHHNVVAGAVLLADAASYFPAGSVHIGVVDPGVGSRRRRIIVLARVSESNEPAYFVGPDNGLFSLAAPKSTRVSAWEIAATSAGPTAMAKMRGGKTFEGRDIFAPVGALIAKGSDPSQFGSAINSDRLVELAGWEKSAVWGGEAVGRIWRFDSFGNAFTTICSLQLEKIGENPTVELTETGEVLRFVTHYEELNSNELGALLNSQGYLELATKEQSAEEKFGLTIGQLVKVS